VRALVFGALRGCRRTSGARPAVEDVHAIVIDAETVPSIDVTAARMLLALRADLERDRVEAVGHPSGVMRHHPAST
jgi:hypothetical protein